MTVYATRTQYYTLVLLKSIYFISVYLNLSVDMYKGVNGHKKKTKIEHTII